MGAWVSVLESELELVWVWELLMASGLVSVSALG
jgi:hypothetical protein